MSTTSTSNRTETQSASQSGALKLINVDKVYNPKKPNEKAVDDFTLAVEPGQFVTLLGPSGCGKTTTLRMIAGFETPTEGDILIDDQSVVTVPPNKRPMSMVFQSYALFPHLTVKDNVGFGLTAQHASKTEKVERVGKVMDLMGIEQYSARYPHELSGGQQQRVALARALVMEPSILLFDEPLSNLDAKLRVRMREEIRALQQRLAITSVFVTHDQSEAMTMSDLVVVMSEGRIRQVGTPQEIYHHPADTFVASFLGTANFVEGVVNHTQAVEGGSSANVRIGQDDIDFPAPAGLVAGDRVTVMVRSEHLHVVPGRESAAGRSISGTIETASFDGSIVRYTIDTPLGSLQGQAPGNEPALALGAPVQCVYQPLAAWVIGEGA